MTEATCQSMFLAVLHVVCIPVQKFASDAERVLAVILDRDAMKWFKPAKGQFQIFYQQGADHPEY